MNCVVVMNLRSPQYDTQYEDSAFRPDPSIAECCCTIPRPTLKMPSMAHLIPTWVERMSPRRWYALSGDRPDLGLPATAPGTRYLLDNDPARDPRLNPARSLKERLRRTLGRDPKSPWHGTGGISAITECWNGAVYASRYGTSGSMIIFGGGHNDYFGSDVHAFDIASREWRRIRGD